MKHSTADVLDAIDETLAVADHAHSRALEMYDEAMESVRDLLDGAMGGFEPQDENDPLHLQYRQPGNRTGFQITHINGSLCPGYCLNVRNHPEVEALDLPLIGGTPWDYEDLATAPRKQVEDSVREHLRDLHEDGDRGFSRHEVTYAGLPADAAWDAEEVAS